MQIHTLLNKIQVDQVLNSYVNTVITSKGEPVKLAQLVRYDEERQYGSILFREDSFGNWPDRTKDLLDKIVPH